MADQYEKDADTDDEGGGGGGGGGGHAGHSDGFERREVTVQLTRKGQVASPLCFQGPTSQAST